MSQLSARPGRLARSCCAFWNGARFLSRKFGLSLRPVRLDGPWISKGKSSTSKQLSETSFEGIDIAFFSAGGETSRRFVPLARDAGAIVIDNSSVFRMEPDVPLVIPEINGADVQQHHGIIANPNCTTAVALMALYPLHRAFQVRRIFAASYQAVSGAGARAIAELKHQIESAAQDRAPRVEVFSHPIAFNVLPHVDVFLDDGYTKEGAQDGKRIAQDHAPS